MRNTFVAPNNNESKCSICNKELNQVLYYIGDIVDTDVSTTFTGDTTRIETTTTYKNIEMKTGVVCVHCAVEAQNKDLKKGRVYFFSGLILITISVILIAVFANINIAVIPLLAFGLIAGVALTVWGWLSLPDIICDFEQNKNKHAIDTGKAFEMPIDKESLSAFLCVNLRCFGKDDTSKGILSVSEYKNLSLKF